MHSLCDKFVQQISNCLVYVPHGGLPVEWQVATGNWQLAVDSVSGMRWHVCCCMLHVACGKRNKNAFHARNMTWLNLFYFGAFNDFAQTTIPTTTTMPQPQPETPLQLAGADSAHTHTRICTQTRGLCNSVRPQ